MKVAWIAIAALTVTGCLNGGSKDPTSSASGGGAPTSGSGGAGGDGGAGAGGAGAGGSMGTAGSSSSSGSGGKNAGTGDWSCLGSQGATSGATVTYGITFVNRATHAPNKGLKVTICETGALITDCVTADPNGDVKAKGTTDDGGKVVLHVPVSNSDGFSGFIHAVDGVDAGGAMIDEKVFVNFVEDQGLTINTFAKADVTALGSALGVDIDLEKNGFLDGVVLDCNYARPSGATITNDQAETVYFLEDGKPSKTAKATDASGEFFILNAAFAITGLQMANSDGDAITGISVAPNPGVVTTVAVPHTH